MILPGFVKKVMSYGIFIEFSTGIFGLAPNSVSIPKIVILKQWTCRCYHLSAHGDLVTSRVKVVHFSLPAGNRII